MNIQPSSPDCEQPDGNARKAYHKPQLTEFGALSKITAADMAAYAFDGAIYDSTAVPMS